MILGIRRLNTVLSGVDVDESAISRDLNEHWEVLSEAVQVRLRALGMADATRGHWQYSGGDLGWGGWRITRRRWEN